MHLSDIKYMAADKFVHLCGADRSLIFLSLLRILLTAFIIYESNLTNEISRARHGEHPQTVDYVNRLPRNSGTANTFGLNSPLSLVSGLLPQVSPG